MMDKADQTGKAHYDAMASYGGGARAVDDILSKANPYQSYG